MGITTNGALRIEELHVAKLVLFSVHNTLPTFGTKQVTRGGKNLVNILQVNSQVLIFFAKYMDYIPQFIFSI